MLRHKSEMQHQIPVISNLPSTYFHLYTHRLTYTNPHSDTLSSASSSTNGQVCCQVKTRKWGKDLKWQLKKSQFGKSMLQLIQFLEIIGTNKSQVK